jgi:general nucleoside transport system permease protein
MAEQIFTIVFITGLLSAAIRMATPIVLSATGEIFSELSGVLNIGIEGIMLMGCLGGFIGTYYSGNLFIGIISGMITGAIMGFIMAFLCITMEANQIACGIILNLFSIGFTGFVFRIICGITLMPPKIKTLPSLPVPLLDKIPFFGQILFNQNLLIYITFFLVIFSYLFIYKTVYGLKIRAAGEHPAAADTMGVNVYFIRYICVTAGGVFAGLGGTFLVINLGVFVDNMTAGRGFIALACVIFGRLKPFSVMIGAIIFGLAVAFQLRLQALGYNFPHELLLAMPYLLTILILSGVVKKASPPSALTLPYRKEKSL